MSCRLTERAAYLHSCFATACVFDCKPSRAFTIHVRTMTSMTMLSVSLVLLQREAEQEAARLSAIQDAKQREFEEREAKAAAELKHRLEVEQRTIAEQQQRQRAELERQRR